ncbi:acyltransferase [Ferruginibacter profundus]
MLVVLLHITYNCKINLGYNFLSGIFMFGGSGVDIFFVLSGFIIAYSNRKYIGKPSSVPVFLKRRFIRVFPIYWLVITVFLLLQIALPYFYKSHFDTSLTNILQTFLLLPGHEMLNGVSWSLTNEIFFYLLFTLALIIPNKKYLFFLFAGYFILLVVFAVPGISLGNNIYLNMLVYPMNIEFLLGILVVIIVQKISAKIIYPFLAIGVLYFTGSAILSYNGASATEPGPGGALNRVILYGVPSFFIILSLVKMELTKTVKLKSIFLSLGDASYSIYLIHLPIVAAYFKLIAKLNIQSNMLLFFLTLLLFIAVCLLGIVVYNKIEKPVINKLNRKSI